MPQIPTVTITVDDNGSVVSQAVPQQNVQLKVGCAVGGAVNQPYATSNPNSLQAQLIGGPLVEAGGLVCQAGNIVVAVACPIATPGTATAVVATVPGGSTSTVTTTLDSTNGAWDTYYVQVKCVTGGTIGTAGIVLQVSGDAGRNFGNPIPIGTATTLVLGAPFSPVTAGGTGIQLNFGAGTMVAGDFWKFSTTGPKWSDAGFEAAIAAFQISQYGVAGVGSGHLVGACASGDITALQTQMQAGVAIYEYQRMIAELVDVTAPVAWGGAGQTEAAWIAALQTVTSGLNAQPRVCADGGWYNIPSPYLNSAFGSPSYRHPLAWAHAVRRTQSTPNVRAGRVLDGPYSNIVVNPQTDPADGFVYHDERTTPGLNIARIGSAMTWPKKGQGFFQCQEPLLSAPGSQFTEIVVGNVVDIACDIGYASGVDLVSDNLVTQTNGTLDPSELSHINGDLQSDLNEGLTQNGWVSSVTGTASPSANVLATGNVPITVVVTPNAQVNSISETININTGN
jgi:hypothetical protein